MLDSLSSFFVLESDKDVARIGQTRYIGVLHFNNFILNLSLFIPILGNDCRTALFEKINNVGIVEGDRHDCNFYQIRFLFVTQVWQTKEACLKLMPEPGLESLDAGIKIEASFNARLDPILLYSLPIVGVEVVVKIHFNRVIARSQRLHVPLNVAVFLHSLHKVQVVDNEESNKDRGAAIAELELPSGPQVSFLKDAADLNEHACIFVETLIFN